VRFWLITLGLACATALSASPIAAQAPDGQAVYRDNCRACHGAAGKPAARMVTQFPKMPNLADSAFMRGRSEDSIVVVLRRGVGRDMKSFKDKLSPQEMAAVARYVRGLAGQAPKTP
jgi:mono/diheme cytochrome c family protein